MTAGACPGRARRSCPSRLILLRIHSPTPPASPDGDQPGADFERGQAPAALAITASNGSREPTEGNLPNPRPSTPVTHVKHPHLQHCVGAAGVLVGTLSGLLPTLSATIVVASAESLRAVRDHFSEVVDRVEQHHERVTVTRNGRPVAVLISTDDLAELEATLDVLSDPKTLADIREADLAYTAGNVARGADAVRNPSPVSDDEG